MGFNLTVVFEVTEQQIATNEVGDIVVRVVGSSPDRRKRTCFETVPTFDMRLA